MFKSVSWSSYITSVFVLLIIYYVTIVVMYYRKDVERLLRKFSSGRPAAERQMKEQENEVDE